MAFYYLLSIIFTFSSLVYFANAGLLSEPVSEPDEPNTVPAIPVQTETSTCHLDLSNELFGGVSEACGHNLDRSGCCPVLAAWLYAAHARSALQVPPPARTPVSPESDSNLPLMPESDSQKCVNSLQNSLIKRNINLPQPNTTCDTVLCFCGIRVHQIASLSCPAAFNMTDSYKNVTPTANLKNLEKNCRNSSYAGCTKCLDSLQKLKSGDKNTRKSDGSRASKMLNRDCQLMGLTWLLARNKTAYIPTVSAVLRAMMYSAHPHDSKCSPDQQNMPLAVDSLQFNNYNSNASSPPFISLSLCFLYHLLSILVLCFNL